MLRIKVKLHSVVSFIFGLFKFLKILNVWNVTIFLFQLLFYISYIIT